MLMTRACENEFEEADADEVFVRADLRLQAEVELAHSSVPLTSLRYERVGMCIEPVRANVRRRCRGQDLGRLAANGWIVGFGPDHAPEGLSQWGRGPPRTATGGRMAPPWRGLTRATSDYAMKLSRLTTWKRVQRAKLE
jgi:hypothetical protein